LVTGNGGTFTVSVASDTLTEATQYFRVQIRTGSSSGPVVATSNQVSIINIAPGGYTWTTNSFSPNSRSTSTVSTYSIDGAGFTTSTVTVGSGNQTFPFTFTFTNGEFQGANNNSRIRVYRNSSLIISKNITSTSDSFVVTTSSSANQISFRTEIYASNGSTAVLRIYYTGTVQVWQHNHSHTVDTSPT
jgi:hypothetical protein